MKRTYLAVFISVIYLMGCNQGVVITGGSEGIYSGTDIPATEYPAVGVLLDYTQYPSVNLCTGTLISPRVVLTAAHCVNGALSNRMRFNRSADVRSTMFTENQAGNLAIDQIRIHPNWVDGGEYITPHDIALVRLVAPQTVAGGFPGFWDQFLGPYKAPHADALTVVGYGRNAATTGSGRKRKGTVDFAGFVDFDNATPSSIPDNLLKLTTLAPTPQGTCQGDSGGPAFYRKNSRDWVVGVASGGSSCDANVYSFHTSTYTYYSWIKTNWQSLEPTVTGDLDGNGLVNVYDIDAAALAARSGSGDLMYDLTGNGWVQLADRDYLVTSLMQKSIGDVNLDGSVDAADYVVLRKFYPPNVGGTWGTGDMNGDGVTNSADYGYWRMEFDDP